MEVLRRIFVDHISVNNVRKFNATSNVHMTPSISAKTVDWKRLATFFFKSYIIVAFAIWKLNSIFVSGDKSPFEPPFPIIAGYLLCVVVLSCVAGFQIGQKQNNAALRTFIFIAIGLVFLSISFESRQIFRLIAFFADILINGFMVIYLLCIRRSRNWRSLTFWIWACSINLAREIGLLFCNYWLPPFGNNMSTINRKDFWGLMYNFPVNNGFMEFYWLGYLLAGVLSVAGIALAVQKFRFKEKFNPSPNTAMLVALGFTVCMVLAAISIMRLNHAEFLPTIAINATAIYFCFTGYWRFKSTAFILFAIAAILTTLRIVGLVSLDWYHNSIHNGGIATVEQWFVELLLMSSVVAIICWSAGIIFIFRRLRQQ